MSDRDFEFQGKKFKVSKVDAIRQFHIVRRIGPILSDMLPIMKEIAKKPGKKNIDTVDMDEMAKFVSPIMTGLSKLNDQDAELVLFGLLEAAEIQQSGGNWAKIANGQMLMIQDLDFPVMMAVAGKAFAFNLSGFFGALPRTS